MSEPSYHTTKLFTKTALPTEMRKTHILMNNLVYLCLSIIVLSKAVIYEFWHHYVKLKYGANAKLCYINTDSFIVYVERKDIYKDIAEDVETILDTC